MKRRPRSTPAVAPTPAALAPLSALPPETVDKLRALALILARDVARDILARES